LSVNLLYQFVILSVKDRYVANISDSWHSVMSCCCRKCNTETKGVDDPLVENLVNPITSDSNDNNEILTLQRYSLSVKDRSENGARARTDSRGSGGSYQSKYMQEIMSGAKPFAPNGATAKLAPGLAQRGKNLEVLDGSAEALRRGSRKLFEITNSKKFQGEK